MRFFKPHLLVKITKRDLAIEFLEILTQMKKKSVLTTMSHQNQLKMSLCHATCEVAQTRVLTLLWVVVTLLQTLNRRRLKNLYQHPPHLIVVLNQNQLLCLVVRVILRCLLRLVKSRVVDWSLALKMVMNRVKTNLVSIWIKYSQAETQVQQKISIMMITNRFLPCLREGDLENRWGV